MIKRLFLLACLCVGFSNISTAQQFKHFKVDTTSNGERWRLSLPITFEGVNKLRADLKNHVPRLGFNAIHSFPQEIKKELIKYGGNIYMRFEFNAKGKVFNLTFMGK